jgi:hypothetical protein
MKKNIVASLILVFLIGFSAVSQTYVVMVKPLGSESWGYTNVKGELIIPAKFRKCGEFSKEGFAPIYDPETKKFFFINLKGEVLPTEITDFKLSTVFLVGTPKGFEDGLAMVSQDKKWGYLNSAGKVAIPIKYDKVIDFNEGHAIAQLNGKIFVLDKQGVEKPVEDPSIIDVKSFAEGLAPYTAADKKMGFIDENGKIVIQAQFTGLGYFSNGLAWARTADDKIGYINQKGEWVIQPQFTAAKNFDPETGLARVKIGDNWAYTNKNGQEIIYIKDSNSLGDFSNGLAVGEKNDKKGFYNTKGEWIIQTQFDAVRDFKNGYAAVKTGEKWGIIDKTGKWVLIPSYDGIKDFEIVE